MFVTFYFHDNDFTDDIFQAMKAIDGHYNLVAFNDRPELVKSAICTLANGFHGVKTAMRWDEKGDNMLDYFHAHGRVVFTKQTPDNGNHSAVSIDLDTHYIWIH
jgi:hypothetical protein